MDGGDGNDVFVVEGRRQGKDRIIGGEGYDSIRGGEGDDRIRLLELSPLDSIELIDGGSGFNTLGGSGAANLLDFSETSLLDIATLEGRAGRDTIIGSSGDDVIDGGRGRDTLSGGAGNDTYLFAPGDGRDAIDNGDPDSSARDVLRMDDIAHDEVWLSRKRDHLVMTMAGTRDRVLVRNWYSDEAGQLDVIYAGGHVLIRDQVDKLVNAMAAFDVPDGVGEVISEQARTELEPVLASVWQLAG
jgi:Ca2+-binding RTX toxin-like protein